MLSIIKTRKGKHLTQKERDFIAILRAEGKSLDYIKDIIGKSKSTVSRELNRNRSEDGTYIPSEANQKYQKRKSEALKGNRIRDIFTQEYIIEKLKDGWSPEQISGRLNLEYPSHYICTETIYSWIYDPKTKEKSGEDLSIYLTFKQPKRRKKGAYRRTRKVLIPNRIPIEERPKEVDERKELGHWETDSIVSRESQAALNTMVERVTNLILITKLERKTAEETRKAQVTKLGVFPLQLRKTITADNGSEHVEHEKVTLAIGSKFYFATPYHSWERGINENANGLVRRYFPKRTDFKKVTQEEIKAVENLLNNRPRKRLRFKTPLEVFYELTKQPRAA